MSKNSTQEMLELAFSLHQNKQFDRAEEIYKAILKEKPAFILAQHGLGILLAQTDRHKKALTYLRGVLDKDPGNPTYQLSIANVLLALQDFSQAKLHYKEAIKISPNYIQAINNLGNAYFKTGDFLLAKKYYQKAVDHSPLPQYIFNLANAHLSLNHPREAIQSLKSITQHPDFLYEAKKLMAQAHLKICDYDNALKWYLQALALNPDDANSQHEAGVCYLQIKQYTKAVSKFLKVIDLEPEHTEAYYHLANTYLAMGRYTLAKSYYLKQLHYAKLIECYFNVGVLHERESRHQDAITFFKSCLEINPNYTPALQNIASSYLQINRIDLAINHYEKLHKLDQDNLEYQHILSALKQTQTPENAPEEYIQNLFNHYAPHYNTHMQDYLNYQVPKKIFELLRTFHFLTKPLEHIIDLGCGSGLSGQVLHTYTSALTGIDLSSKMLDEAKKTGVYNHLVCGNIQDGLKKIHTADGVIASDVFSYLGDLNQLFNDVFNILTINGFFCFTIEKTYQFPYILQKSIRYAHHKKYIYKLAKLHQFDIITYENIQLRKHHHRHIEGYLFLLKKPA